MTDKPKCHSPTTHMLQGHVCETSWCDRESCLSKPVHYAVECKTPTEKPDPLAMVEKLVREDAGGGRHLAWIFTREETLAAIAAEKERREAVRYTLEKCEWTTDSEWGEFCSYCDGLKENGHRPECRFPRLRELGVLS